ncbi:MAG: penicillin-binding protein 2 [Rickettsiales bacterium]|jgi:penicillin-binding protein 2|nr:penicillin-binding protein 2 [Rickettsiales bacterium]
MIDNDLIKKFNRRTFIIGLIQITAIIYLIIKLFKLQVIDYKKYKKMSDRNSLRLRFIVPPRGIIYDRNGNALASNQKSYSAYLIAEETIKSEKRSLTQVLKDLSSGLNLSNNDLEQILDDIENQKKFLPVLIKQDLNWEQMAKLESNSIELPGVFIEEEYIRLYPHKQITSHVIGYVSKADKEDLETKNLILEKVPNFKIGKTGIEKQFDETLRGKPGEVYQLVNAYGRTVHTIEDEENKAIPGHNLQLTIDQRLQDYTSSIVKQNSASVVLMSAENGDILSMSSFPEFDLSIFEGNRIDTKKVAELNTNPYLPLINKAVSGQYAPGSTFKMIVALAALENNIIDPKKKIVCDGSFTFGNHKYHCWKEKGHGPMDMIQALQNSCDVYFYKLSLEVGIDKIEKTALKFGLGKKTDLDMISEKSGIVPNQVWKARNLGQMWSPADTIMTSIGQGFTLCTPIQLAQMTARLANGKLALTPRIIKSAKDYNFNNLEINPQHLKTVQQGMFNVMNVEGATAYYYRFNYNGQKMAGKTGTTQVRRITEAERKSGKLTQDQVEYKLRNHALFVGYAPFDNPKFAVSVVVEHGGSGSGVAAPIGSSVLKKALELS